MNGRGRHPAAVWTDVQNCPATPCPLCRAEARADGAESDLAAAHRALTKLGVPEQIPPIKAPLAHVTVRILWLSARADRLQERLDQYGSYAITVDSALRDRERADRLAGLIREWAESRKGATLKNYGPVRTAVFMLEPTDRHTAACEALLDAAKEPA